MIMSKSYLYWYRECQQLKAQLLEEKRSANEERANAKTWRRTSIMATVKANHLEEELTKCRKENNAHT